MPVLAANAPHPGRRVATGIAVSIFLHALLLTVLRPPAPSAAPDARRWSQEISIRLLPPPPVTIAEPAAPPALPTRPPRTAEPGKPKPERQAAGEPARKPLEAIYVPAPSAPDISENAAPADTAPRFDPNAARATARNIASTLDEPKSDAPNAQVNRGPRYRESRNERLGREIQSAARANCKDGLPGGLLAPLYLMMDKKDSGCKW